MPLYCSLIKCHKQLLFCPTLYSILLLLLLLINRQPFHKTQTYSTAKIFKLIPTTKMGERVGKPRCALRRCVDVVPLLPLSLSLSLPHSLTHMLAYYYSLSVFFHPLSCYTHSCDTPSFSDGMRHAPLRHSDLCVRQCTYLCVCCVCVSVCVVCVRKRERDRKRLSGLIVAYFKNLARNMSVCKMRGRVFDSVALKKEEL
jgi:hypothetical protein